jgi:hypothetical protein
MKLARANLFIVRNAVSGRSAQHRGLPVWADVHRGTSNHPCTIRRPSGRLAAHWHVCPQTQRLECAWSLEATASDSQLWRYPLQRRRGQTRRLLTRRSIYNQRPLSQIRNRAL